MARKRKLVYPDIPAPVPPPASPDAILTLAEVAAWMKTEPRQLQRMGIPYIDLGERTKRYHAEDVRQWLAVKRAESLQRAA